MEPMEIDMKNLGWEFLGLNSRPPLNLHVDPNCERRGLVTKSIRGSLCVPLE